MIDADRVTGTTLCGVKAAGAYRQIGGFSIVARPSEGVRVTRINPNLTKPAGRAPLSWQAWRRGGFEWIRPRPGRFTGIGDER
jgi:hypothetical protein